MADSPPVSSSPAHSFLTHLECSVTGGYYDADVVQGLSAAGAPLLARYDLERVRAELDRDAVATRPATMWRYHELLPVRDPAHVTTLGEGWTPLLPLPTHGAAIGLPRLMVKDEGTLPTGSFKARGASVGLSRARELGVSGVGMPTNGNAGAAWSMYAARAGIPTLIGMPVGAPEICRRAAPPGLPGSRRLRPGTGRRPGRRGRLLDVPDNDDEGLGVRFDLFDQRIAELRSHGVMYDRDHTGDPARSHPAHRRGVLGRGAAAGRWLRRLRPRQHPGAVLVAQAAQAADGRPSA